MFNAEPIKQTGTEPEFFAEGLAAIQFLGVNTRYVMYRNLIVPARSKCRQTVFSAVLPTGALPMILRQLAAFAMEHRLRVPDHIAP